MRIPLIISEDIIILNCFIRAPDYHNVYGNIKFIVDTGSTDSFIGEIDAIKLRIPISRLGKNEEKQGRGLAGGSIILYAIKNVTLSFLSENKRIEKIHFQHMDVGLSARKDEKSRIRESILGNDFLLKNNLTLVFNPSKQIAYLEKND